MEELRISYGEYRVYSSGCIIAYSDTPVKFCINDLTVSLKFEENPNIHDFEVSSERGESRKDLILRLVNFNNNLGTGPKKPLLIGNIGDFDIYLLFIARRLANSPVRSVDYTWLLKEKIAD